MSVSSAVTPSRGELGLAASRAQVVGGDGTLFQRRSRWIAGAGPDTAEVGAMAPPRIEEGIGIHRVKLERQLDD